MKLAVLLSSFLLFLELPRFVINIVTSAILYDVGEVGDESPYPWSKKRLSIGCLDDVKVGKELSLVTFSFTA